MAGSSPAKWLPKQYQTLGAVQLCSQIHTISQSSLGFCLEISIYISFHCSIVPKPGNSVQISHKFWHCRRQQQPRFFFQRSCEIWFGLIACGQLLGASEQMADGTPSMRFSERQWGEKSSPNNSILFYTILY